jgi:hypothetical protein
MAIQQTFSFAGYQVVMKSSTFWDITQCNPLKVKGRFTGKCRPHLQLFFLSLSGWVFLGLLFNPEDISLKCRLASAGQKTELFTWHSIPEDITLHT